MEAGYGTEGALSAATARLHIPAAACVRVNTLRARPEVVADELARIRTTECGPALERLSAAAAAADGGGLEPAGPGGAREPAAGWAGGGVEPHPLAPECLLIRPVYNPHLEEHARTSPRAHAPTLFAAGFESRRLRIRPVRSLTGL